MHPQSEPQNHSQTQPQRTRRCRHIHAAGHQCGSPCLRTEQFCYFHHTTRRPVSDPKARRVRATTYDLPVPEDRDSILAAIAQVMHDIANNHIEPRRAGLILYSLQLALCALPKEPRMNSQSVNISAAARPATRRNSRRNSIPIHKIPAEPIIQETVLDDTYGLIAPETFLEPELASEEEDEEYDSGDEVQEDGRLLRDTFGYRLLKEVELYEARQQGYERARADLLKEGELHAPQSKTGIDIDAAAKSNPAAEAENSANRSFRNTSVYHSRTLVCHSRRESTSPVPDRPGAPSIAAPSRWVANRYRSMRSRQRYRTAPAIASSN